jgi:hypothetical protein
VNVWRGEVSGCGEIPGVGADLDGEGRVVTKVENHGFRSVHSPARLDLSVLYGRYRFADGPENCLQFILRVGWADYLGVFSATRLLAVHPRSFDFLQTTSTFRHRASYPYRRPSRSLEVFGRFFFMLVLMGSAEPDGVFGCLGRWVIAYLLSEEMDFV